MKDKNGYRLPAKENGFVKQSGGTKKCISRKCVHNGKPQDKSNFYRSIQEDDGLCNECKDCRYLRQRVYAKKKSQTTKDFFNTIIG